jgi:hypothetical protein
MTSGEAGGNALFENHYPYQAGKTFRDMKWGKEKRLDSQLEYP